MDFCFSKTAPIVETTKGKLRGFHFNGVDHFYGIRYAKAKRFQMPEPVEPWEGVKDAGSYGMNCPVLGEPQPMGEVMIPHRFWPSSEHCQYLNVWTSSYDPAAKKPVMFWIHGGGYSAGSAIEQICYDGFNLAKLDDVVVVTVNHRLNAFGYLDMSAFGEKYKNSVNVGMADLVEALRWVRDNIAQFGGDPDNVTIFGQSGGGTKVTVLGQIPEADGLFHKAIVMSGVIAPGRNEGVVGGKELVLEILKPLNIPEQEAEKLEKVPVPQFIWAVNKAVRAIYKQGKRVSWGPVPNDYYVCDPLEGDFTAHSLTVPTMVGSVLAEFAFGPGKDLANMTEADSEKLVKDHFGPEGGEKILAAFRKSYPNTDPAFAVDMDDMFLPATVDYVKKKAKESSAPVYNYIFTKVFDYDGGKAAWHCSDIPYFFHNAEMIPVCHQPNYKALNWMMSGAFVNFARTGNPNTEGLPNWDKCEDGRMITMVFDDACYTQVNMQDELIPLMAEYTVNNSGYFDEPDFRPTVTTFPVPEGTEIKGAVLVCAGGAFQFRSDEMEGTPVARELSRQGYQSFVVDYRLRPYTQEEGALDLARAVRFVRKNAAVYGIDPEDIAVMGFSAGGILAGEQLLLYAGDLDGTALDSRYQPDALDKISADAAACGMIYSFYGRLSVASLDVEEFRSAGLPPTYFCYGTRDPFYRQFGACVDALREAGVQVDTNVLEGRPHGYGYRENWIPAYADWLESVFAAN